MLGQRGLVRAGLVDKWLRCSQQIGAVVSGVAKPNRCVCVLANSCEAQLRSGYLAGALASPAQVSVISA